MAVIWSVKEDYSFALTQIDTVYNLLVDTWAVSHVWPPISAEGKGPPYIIIKDGVLHRERRLGAASSSNVRMDKANILKFKPETRAGVLNWVEKKALLSFLLFFSDFVTVESYTILENLNPQMETFVPSRR